MKWLFKTEPSDYSFERLQKEGRTTWTGVKNPLALKHLRGVKRGDEIAIYHTGAVKSVVGIAKALGDAQADAVDLAPLKSVAPVTLASVKADPRFKEFPLVRMGRLSVMPVPAALWTPLTTVTVSASQKR